MMREAQAHVHLRQRLLRWAPGTVLALLVVLWITVVRDTPDQRFVRELLLAWKTYARAAATDDAVGCSQAAAAARQTIREADAYVLPNLVEWIGPVPPTPRTREWGQKLSEYWPFSRSAKFQRWAHMEDDDPQIRCAGAMWFFQLLGTNASSAIPELSSRASQPGDFNPQWRANQALKWARGMAPDNRVLTQPAPVRGMHRLRLAPPEPAPSSN